MAQSDIQIEPFFLESPRGSMFCIYFSPIKLAHKGSILYLHPFGEEMHKSRRIAALQARAFASLGYAVLQIDLTGCGDSVGDFADASWSAWRNDARLAHAWLLAKTAQPITLWGLRTGALLAVDLAQQLNNLQGLLLWQPGPDGGVFLTQFLRIKLASDMLAEGKSKLGTKEMLASLEANQSVEVGGNRLSPAMAREMGGVKLAAMHPVCPITWLEVGTVNNELLGPASQRVAEAWRNTGAGIQSQTVVGDPFWATQEISECPQLINATLAHLAA